MSNKYTRRSFLENITTATLGAMGAGSLLFSSHSSSEPDTLGNELPEGATILFQGDSITDAGRDKDNANPNDPWALGQGYAFLAAAALRHSMAAKNLQCYNKGISGNKVFQLSDRWQQDCLALEPDVLSILIGVNDFWHALNDYDGTVEVYEKDFRALLKRTKEQLPDVQLIIGEPFVVEEGTAVDDRWFPEFPLYQKVARQIAEGFDTAFIPYQQVFDSASEEMEPTYWTADGVHPTMAGAELMAQAWLETFRRL
ncbi:SGNH/GDSL hydrolase family protein [Aliifodinibius sp. S!AR15-10]|uniref:SGNH/GDSL hydrolase family protein n=1 Tax=Aliifodinibius sp. S!AR15-10 TaxID=2950437 RepID=UPI00285C56DC|nr:SGNH/GDSL hydrolase family protein [Aliifodinibius sp. S!AR15-10]MDR8391541.1 SGNH/GDSL hydrolase family protein [Aliifodinibius sp. S!AR15-10]